MPHAKSCEVHAQCGCCSQKPKSKKAASMKSLGIGSTAVYLKRYALYGANSPKSAAYRHTFYLPTPPSGRWRESDRDPLTRFLIYAASANVSSRTSDNAFSK